MQFLSGTIYSRGGNIDRLIMKLSTAVDQVLACAPVTQRTRVRSPVGRSSWVRFFGFFLTCKTNVRKLQAHNVPEYHLTVNHPSYSPCQNERVREWYRLSCSCYLGGGPDNELIPHSGRTSMPLYVCDSKLIPSPDRPWLCKVRVA